MKRRRRGGGRTDKFDVWVKHPLPFFPPYKKSIEYSRNLRCQRAKSYIYKVQDSKFAKFSICVCLESEALNIYVNVMNYVDRLKTFNLTYVVMKNPSNNNQFLCKVK